MQPSWVLLSRPSLSFCRFRMVSSFARINSWRAPNKATEEDSDGQSGLLFASLRSFPSTLLICCRISVSSFSGFVAAGVVAAGVVAASVVGMGIRARTVWLDISRTRFGGSMGSDRTSVVILTGSKKTRFRSMVLLKSGAETRVLSLFVGFLGVWAVNQASVQSGGLHVKCTCSRPIRKFVYVIARVARGGVIPSKRDFFTGCSWYCEPGWSRGSCHDVVQTESSFGVIFVTFALSNFFKWLFGWAEIMTMARLSIGLMHRCSVDVAMSVVRCCRRRLWREITWMVIVRTPPWRFSQG